MNGESLCSAERGVSKVVGVVLLVGITVLLVAGVATITTGIAGETPTQEQVDFQQSAFSFELERNVTYSTAGIDENCYSGEPNPPWPDGSCLVPPNDAYVGDRLTITYEGGNTLSSENIRLLVNGAEVKYVNDSNYIQDYGSGYYHGNYTLDQLTESDNVSAGETVTLVTNYGDLEENSGTDYSPEALLREATVRIIYEGGQSDTVVTEWEGPEA